MDDNGRFMANQPPFAIIFGPEVRDHMRVIEAKHHSSIRSNIDEQLRFEPETETRNRKPLTRPVSFEATWELRFGPDNRFRSSMRAIPSVARSASWRLG